MSQNTRINVPAGNSGQWTQLTDSSTVGEISVMLASNTPVMLQATDGQTAPTAGTLGPLALLSYGDGWSQATIVAKFPGVPAADALWARRLDADIGLGAADAIVGISHA